MTAMNSFSILSSRKSGWLRIDELAFSHQSTSPANMQLNECGLFASACASHAFVEALAARAEV